MLNIKTNPPLNSMPIVVKHIDDANDVRLARYDHVQNEVILGWGGNQTRHDASQMVGVMWDVAIV